MVAPLTVCRINADRQLNKSMLFYRLGDTKNKQRNKKIPAIPMTILSAHLGLFCNGWDKDTWRHSRQWSPPIHYQSSSLHIDGHRIMFLSPGNINGSTCQGHKPRLACSPPTIRDNDFAAHRCHFRSVETAAEKNKETSGITDDAKIRSFNTQMTDFAECLRPMQIPRLQRMSFGVRNFTLQYLTNENKTS